MTVDGPAPPPDDRWIAAVVDRLDAELDMGFPAIRATVRGCQRDLAGAPPGALPELVERLARQRILDAPCAVM